MLTSPSRVVLPTAPLKVMLPCPAVSFKFPGPSRVLLKVMEPLLPLVLNSTLLVRFTGLLNSTLLLVIFPPVETLPRPFTLKVPPRVIFAVGAIVSSPVLVMETPPVPVVVMPELRFVVALFRAIEALSMPVISALIAIKPEGD